MKHRNDTPEVTEATEAHGFFLLFGSPDGPQCKRQECHKPLQQYRNHAVQPTDLSGIWQEAHGLGREMNLCLSAQHFSCANKAST